jgi:uncharacterized membrane protein YesL
MSILDLSKATVTCGGTAFLLYTFPTVAQIVTIGILSILWLSYAYKVWNRFRGRGETPKQP